MSDNQNPKSYTYLCGECLTEAVLTMDEITAHWRGHVAGRNEEKELTTIRD